MEARTRTEETSEEIAREEISVKLADVIKECKEAINKHDLIKLIAKAKRRGLESLTVDQRENLCAGLIKLGEALTFCRDDDNYIIKFSQISPEAILFANARNYFIHHYMYDANTHNPYQKADACIRKLPFIKGEGYLLDKIGRLENIHAKESEGQQKEITLSKKIGRAQNNFLFLYEHLINSLENEFKILSALLKHPSENNMVAFDNHIRNILAIMVDLADEKKLNSNLNDPCLAYKEAVRALNNTFIGEHTELAPLFLRIKEFRNALSHLDDSLRRPYSNFGQMIEFAQDLNKVAQFGYIKNLREEVKKKIAIEEESSYSRGGKKERNTTKDIFKRIQVVSTPKRKRSERDDRRDSEEKGEEEKQKENTLSEKKENKLLKKPRPESGFSLVDSSYASSDEEPENAEDEISKKSPGKSN